MSQAALQVTRSQVNRWFLVQIFVIVVATLSCLLLQGLFIAKSVCLGGFLCLVPQWVFARLWLSYYKASAAPKLASMFYIGGVIKLLLTGALFILMLKYITLHVVACLVGFIIAQVTFWIAPLLILLWGKTTQKTAIDLNQAPN